MLSKKKLLTELCLKQRKHNNDKYQLEINDLTRFLKYVNVSIFNTDDCILWTGYLTKCNNNKSCYINYYLNGLKLALHRILYINFIGDLKDKEYLKYSCLHSGKCCNLKHFSKVNDSSETIIEPVLKILKPPTNNVVIRKSNNPSSPARIIIIFKD
jgi:hypothetical protein